MTTKVFRSELTPVSFLQRSAYIFPEKTAVVQQDRRYTYAELAERVNRLASGLRNAGLRKHDRVAFLCLNGPPLLEGHFAVPAAGGILVPINTRLSSSEIAYILMHSGARFLFVDAELENQIEPIDLTGVQVVRVDDTGMPGDPYEELLAAAPADPVESWLNDEEEPISICYTSGTTGQPKGVVYTHRGAYLNALGEVLEAAMSFDSVYLWSLPMFHCNGWCIPWAVVALAGVQVCLRKVDPGRMWELFGAEGVTHYSGAPTVHIGLVHHPAARRLERQVTAMLAAAPPSPALITRMQALNLRPVHVYGLTESYGPITVCEWHPSWDKELPEEQARLLARQGQGYITADLVRVVDPDGCDVPRDGRTIGEVVMRGNNVMWGYWDQPEATEKAFQGGWFHSGDLGVWHPDGNIELRDRAKDIIISGGENISTIEVEQALANHPAVLECAVIAVPHETWGERPKAFVTLKPGTSAEERELIDFCRDRIAHFKCPDAIEFGALPKTSTGKVQKNVLREREWAGYEKRIH